MKKVLLLSVVALVSATSFSQTAKGTWMLGGSAGFESEKANGATASTTTIHVNPNLGYFIGENFAIGANIGLWSVEKVGSSFNFGPMARYYFTDMGKSAKLFAHAGMNFGSYTPTGGSAATTTSWMIAAGPAFFLNKNIALETTLNYSSSKAKGATGSDNSFGLNVGFQIHL